MMRYDVYKEQFHEGAIEMQETASLKEEPCPICCEEVKDTDDIVYLPCNVRHVYHT